MSKKLKTLKLRLWLDEQNGNEMHPDDRKTLLNQIDDLEMLEQDYEDKPIQEEE